eukprot:PITA_31867
MANYVQLSIGILGNAASLLLYGAPIVTFRRVIKRRSTGDFSGLPYAITLLNCLLYAWYGSSLISNGLENILVLTVNGIGIILELSFVCIYLKFAPRKSKLAMVTILVGVMMVFASIATVSQLALHDHKSRKTLVGTSGMIATVVMYASPLSVIKLVIRTKSVEFMPFHFSLFIFINSCLWMTYFLLDKDLILACPNIVGLPLGISQIVLYCMYRKQPVHEEQKVLDQLDPEIGLKEMANPEDKNCNSKQSVEMRTKMRGEKPGSG